MDCSAALNLYNAWLDGELDRGELTALEAHLAGCGDCRAAADALKLEDADLRRAFAPRRQAADTIARRAMEQLRCEVRPPRVRRAWPSLATAAAAGFLLAVAVLRPWQGPREAAPLLVEGPSERPIARLALATGATETPRPIARAQTWRLASLISRSCVVAHRRWSISSRPLPTATSTSAPGNTSSLPPSTRTL